MTTTATVIAGTKPHDRQPCKPDGRCRWATRSFAEGQWTFVTYNGWLIVSETTTDDRALAEYITKALRMEMGPWD